MTATGPDREADETRRKRRGRNIAMALALAALVVLFYVVTIVKWGGGS